MGTETIQELLKKSFEKHSQEIAIKCGSTLMTYNDLHIETDKLTRRLLDKGLEKGAVVGVFVEDKVELIIIMISLLKAGCAFMPLDPTYPANRLRSMLEIAQPKFVFADEMTYENLKKVCNGHYQGEILFQKELAEAGKEDTCCSEYETEYGPDNLIYIFFTSGSTGKPKAVMGRNKGLSHFVEWELGELGITTGYQISQLTSPCHDPFLRDVLTPICAGGTVCIPENKNIIINPKALANWIEEAGINVIHCTPSLFRVLNNAPMSPDSFIHLKYVLLAGERVIPTELARWYEIIGSRIQLLNLYGPTETTLAKLYYFIQPQDVSLNSIPIGKPIRGAKAIILDSNRNVCNHGEVGEIYIRTAYRSLGYLNDPVANADRFVPNPFSDNPADVVYRTGDLGRMLPDDNIEFVGRTDRQVKIRGFRIELDEIEGELIKCEDIQACAVTIRLAKDDYPGVETTNEEYQEDYITAYYVSDSEPSLESLRNHLEGYLPEYAIPTYFVQIEYLPLTANGKINYKELPSPRKFMRSSYTPFRNPLEEKLTDIWSEILGIEQIGINENFFHIGGHSLKVMSLVSMIYQEFGVEIPLSEIFWNPTIEKMAGYIAQEKGLDATWDSNERKKAEQKGQNADTGPDTPRMEEIRSLGQRYIEGVEPFNDIFYINCFFSALFPVINHYRGSILPILANYTMLYYWDDNQKGIKLNTRYEAEIKIETIVESQGINVGYKAKCDDVVMEIIKAISGNKLVIIEIDCFYEPIRRDMYMKNHWPHYLLVFGFDTLKEEFHIIEHGNINRLNYQKRVISFEDIRNSYNGYLTSFPRTEDMVTFYEFSSKDTPVCNISEYSSIYKKNIINNIQLITDSLQNIMKFKIEFEEIISDEARLNVGLEGLLVVLENIVNAKYAERYKILTLLGEQVDCLLILEEIIENWQFIKTVIEKYRFSQIFRYKSLRSCTDKIEDIYRLEHQYYDRFLLLFGKKSLR